MSTTRKAPANKRSFIKVMMDEAGNRLPKYKPYIEAATPYVVGAADAVDRAYPYAVVAYAKAKEGYALLQPYHPEQYLPLATGLIMCFFGGSYLTIIATIECVRLGVWQRLYTGLKILYENYLKAEEASKKDDAVDADGNGVADVLEITDKELFTRKVFLFAQTVDPNQVSDAVNLVWAGMLSVLATLRVHFAQAVTLGCSLGEIAESHLSVTTEPLIRSVLPPQLAKWGPVVNSSLFKFVGVLCAWFLTRIIAGFHAAMRGGHLFVKHALILAKDRGLVDASLENSPRASMLAAVVGFLGFYWQLSNGFALPFPLNVLLFPVSIVEWLLSVLVGVSAAV